MLSHQHLKTALRGYCGLWPVEPAQRLIQWPELGRWPSPSEWTVGHGVSAVPPLGINQSELYFSSPLTFFLRVFFLSSKLIYLLNLQ